MSLKVGRRPGHTGLWISGTVTPAGAKKGVRIRRRAGSTDPKLAAEEAGEIERKILRAAIYGESPTVRGWAEAVAAYERHAPRSVGTIALLVRLTRHFLDTPIDKIDQDAVEEAAKVILRPGAAPATVVRNVIVPVRAVLEHAAWMRWGPEPRIKAPEIDDTTPKPQPPDVVARMIERAPDHFRPLVIWLAGTGCRVGETLALDWAQVDLQARIAILLPETTKAGKRRVVELYPAVVEMLGALSAKKEGRVFRRTDGEPYRDSDYGGGQLRTPWATTCQRAGVPGRWQEWKVASKPKRRWVPEIGPHALRHTWASWHHVLNKDLLRLRDEGGWASVGQVECYAHSLPDHHAPAIRKVWGIVTPQWQRKSRTA